MVMKSKCFHSFVATSTLIGGRALLFLYFNFPVLFANFSLAVASIVVMNACTRWSVWAKGICAAIHYILRDGKVGYENSQDLSKHDMGKF